MDEFASRGDGGPFPGDKADRKHTREYLVLPASAVIDGAPPVSCGLMDISVGGAKIKIDGEAPAVGGIVSLGVDALHIRVKGTVIRTFNTPTGVEVALQFEKIYSEIPRGLLDYKLKSFKNLGGGKRGR